ALAASRECLTFDAAEEHCAELELDKRGGWRVPTRIELVSITGEPETPWKGVEGTYWTATERSATEMLVASTMGRTKVYPYPRDRLAAGGAALPRVRCVRGGELVTELSEVERFLLEGEEIDDVVTARVWQANPFVEESRVATEEEAEAWCAQAGKGWRLPRIWEFHALLDESRGVVPFPRDFAWEGEDRTAGVWIAESWPSSWNGITQRAWPL